jgi:hypothetical protein
MRSVFGRSMPNINLQAWFVRGRELFHNIEYRDGDTFSLFSDIIYFKYEQSVLHEDVIFGTEKKWSYKPGDLLKEVQFIWNFIW